MTYPMLGRNGGCDFFVGDTSSIKGCVNYRKDVCGDIHNGESESHAAALQISPNSSVLVKCHRHARASQEWAAVSCGIPSAYIKHALLFILFYWIYIPPHPL
uniref:Uncharacterized protein n=1 Tax=Sphaerodactylus townsendi TaxID=933632 RepID=A0ACB8F6S7_9SAUR